MKQKLESWLKELEHVHRFLLPFLLNPVRYVAQIPPYRWPTLLLIQGTTSMVCGVLLGVTNQSWTDIAVALTLYPPISVIIGLVLSVFFYYYFLFFHATYLEIRALYAILVVAHLPYLILHILSAIVPPIDLVGFAMTCILIHVGMVSQFHLEQRHSRRVLITLYFVFAAMWGIGFVRRLPTHL